MRPEGVVAKALVVFVVAAAGCHKDEPKPTAQGSGPGALSGGKLEALKLQADDAQWVMPTKDYANTRYSGLAEITRENVKRLKLDWTFSTGATRGHEAAPLVVGGTMYVVTPYPNILYALDLTKEGAPMKWRYEPHPVSASQGVACCDTVNRGVAFDQGKLFFNTLDNHTVAVDAESGKELWKTKLGDINKGETITMAPMVARGKVFVGNSGGEFGVRGWLTAVDEHDGHIVWRAYSTGPDADVLIGPRFKPFYAQDRGKDLGVTTWPPDHWKIGGGTVWGFLSYDPELDLIYYGTANPGPWNPDLRPGDNKWTCGVFARKPDTGEAVWFYQFNPHDLFDHDGINEMILLDLKVGGQQRKVLVHPGRNGYLYVIDRATGEVLSAEPYGYINSTSGVDLKTGLLKEVPEKKPGLGRVTRDICPAAPGVKDWQPSAFSPKTGLLYIPHQNLCQDEEGTEGGYIAGTPYVAANVRMTAGHGGYRGVFTAWDVTGGKKRWELTDDLPIWSGAVVTAGDVVFFGTMDGWFKAADAESGAVLWKMKLGSGIIGQPVTFKKPDGHQAVAIMAGVGGWPGAIVSAGLDPRDQTAGAGFVGAMGDLPGKTTKGGAVYTFSLP